MIEITKRIKNLLIISIIPIVFGILYFDLFLLKKHTPNEVTPIPKTIVIINNTRYDVESTTKIMLSKIFTHDSIYVKFQYMKEETYIEKIKLGAFIIKNPFFDNQYVVYMSKEIKPYQKDILLIHEMIHLNQYETKKLIILPMEEIFIYNGDTLSFNNTGYFDRPFELDAYNMQDSIYNEVFKILNNTNN